jgi:hypothetical protein
MTTLASWAEKKPYGGPAAHAERGRRNATGAIAAAATNARLDSTE